MTGVQTCALPIYESNGAIFNELELVALPGVVPFGTDPMVSTAYSYDGVSWSVDQAIRAGQWGNRLKRIAWRRQGHMRNWRVQRFTGDSHAHLPVARLEAALEPLAW